MSWPRLLLTCKFLLRCCNIFRSTKSKKKLKPSGVIPGRPHKNALLAQQQLFALGNSRVRFPLLWVITAPRTLWSEKRAAALTRLMQRVREENCKKRNRTRERESAVWQVREKVLCAHSRKTREWVRVIENAPAFFDNNHTQKAALYRDCTLNVTRVSECLSVCVCELCEISSWLKCWEGRWKNAALERRGGGGKLSSALLLILHIFAGARVVVVGRHRRRRPSWPFANRNVLG